jgi:pyruvate dehydrogenase E2 component (dihydrolipoamide acetyltransferase)
VSEAPKPVDQPLRLTPWPREDFAAYGEVEVQPLSRVQRFVASNLTRNAILIPHVTHHDEADITDLDEHRRALAKLHPKTKITPLIYFMKAAVAALKAFPKVNASLDESGDNIILKKYVNIGIAVETDDGLLVPVIRDCDKKSIPELAREVIKISIKARNKGLSYEDMAGGTFSISSLGSIGGTAFTPIIKAPELAILGITKAYEKPVRIDGELVWRTMLPLSLSYDHRVINGADAARFLVYFSKALSSPQSLVD